MGYQPGVQSLRELLTQSFQPGVGGRMMRSFHLMGTARLRRSRSVAGYRLNALWRWRQGSHARMVRYCVCRSCCSSFMKSWIRKDSGKECSRLDVEQTMGYLLDLASRVWEANIYMSGPQTSGMAGGTKPIHAEK